MSKKVIGCRALVQWCSNNQTEEIYISFGQHNEETEEDSFGIPDGVIGWYMIEGPEACEPGQIVDGEFLVKERELVTQ